MIKISKFKTSLCIGLGLISILGTIPVYATSEAERLQEQYDKAGSDVFTPEQIAQMKKESDELFKNQKQDVAIVEKQDTIPADGDSKNLNIGWTNKQGHHYYCQDSSRVKSTGWQKINNTWYFFDSTSYDMQTGWLQVNGVWYYFKDQADCEEGKVDIEHGLGSMQTGWLNNNGTWYYLGADGTMKANSWVQSGSNWYYLTGSGAMATNTTINGYYVDGSGAWVQ